MKYSSINLNDPGVPIPFPFPMKVCVDYRPGGVLLDGEMVHTRDPEAAADEIVRTKGWDRVPDYKPSDVWVDAGF